MNRRLTLALPLAAVGFGAAGFFLRRWQLETAFEEVSGLLIPGKPATIALVAMLIAAAAICIAIGFAALSKNIPSGYLTNLAAPHAAVSGLDFLAGGLLVAAGAWEIGRFVALVRDWAMFTLSDLPAVVAGAAGEFGVIRLVLSVCLIPTGICMILVGMLGNQRDEGKGRFRSILLAPGYCACVWLVAAYQKHTTNPNIMEYLFLLLGIVCVIFAAYAAASFSFEKPRPILCAVSGTMGIVLLAVSAADRPQGIDLLTLLGFGIYLLTRLICLTACSVRPPQLTRWLPRAETAEASEQNAEEQIQPRGEENE